MKNKVTQRDKKLIVFLGYFLVIVGIGYWGILPQVKQINILNDKIAEARDEVEVVTNKSIFFELIKKRQEYMYADLESEKSSFIPYMTHEELDSFFTGKASELGLMVYEFSVFDSSADFSLAPYQYSVYKEMNDVDIDESLGIYKSTVSIKLGGDTSKLDEFVRTYSYNEKTVVNSYEYENGKSLISQEDEKDILNINITVYMIGEAVVSSEVTVYGK